MNKSPRLVILLAVLLPVLAGPAPLGARQGARDLRRTALTTSAPSDEIVRVDIGDRCPGCAAA